VRELVAAVDPRLDHQTGLGIWFGGRGELMGCGCGPSGRGKASV
jgi:hypothetical protein